MGKISVGRVILGGIVAGIVSDILGYLVDGVLLAPRWAYDMGQLVHHPFSPNQWIWFNLLGILAGIFLVWLYAAIRPRFGAGAMTAIYAGLAVWFIGTLLPNTGFMVVGGLFGKHLALYTTTGGLFETLAGALAGAALYKEDSAV
jgi:hypothetical protein